MAAAGRPKIEVLRQRAELLDRARGFFKARGVLEVDTPLLGAGVVVEEHIDPIPCRVQVRGSGRDALPADFAGRSDEAALGDGVRTDLSVRARVP